MVGGESIFKWQYSNNTDTASYVGMCSTTPGNLVPIDMSQHPEVRKNFACVLVLHSLICAKPLRKMAVA